MQDVDLLKAALAVAVADREITRSEKGVLQGLAARAGVGEASFEAMTEAAMRQAGAGPDVPMPSEENARTALRLLVAMARVDGMISDEERGVLAHVATSLGITGNAFEQIYLSALQQADELRRKRQPKSG